MLKVGLLHMVLMSIVFIIQPKKMSFNTGVLRLSMFGIMICITELKAISTVEKREREKN